MFEKIFTIVVFGAAYTYLCVAHSYRAAGVWLAALVLAAGGVYSGGAVPTGGEAIVTSAKTVFFGVNWTVIGIFAGVMFIANLFSRSNVPLRMSDVLVDRCKTTGGALVLVCALASFISAFVDNVATVLIVAPVVFELSRRLNVDPVAPMIGVAISANLQGMATQIGDTPSMLLAMNQGMSFNDFFVHKGRPGMFFITWLSAGATLSVLYFGFFRTFREKPAYLPPAKVTSWVPTFTLVALCLALAGMSLGPDWLQSPGLTCTGFAVVLFLITVVRSKHMAKQAALHFDWRTVLLLMGIFVVVKALDLVGLTTDIAQIITRSMGGSVLGTYVFIIGISILLSAFIDNIPYITLMLPVASKLSENLGLPSGALLAYGLLVGTCLGGNLTPLGASANVVSVELLRKRGHHVGFWDFARMGIPFTVTATVPAAVVIWFLWR